MSNKLILCVFFLRHLELPIIAKKNPWNGWIEICKDSYTPWGLWNHDQEMGEMFQEMLQNRLIPLTSLLTIRNEYDHLVNMMTSAVVLENIQQDIIHCVPSLLRKVTTTMLLTCGHQCQNESYTLGHLTTKHWRLKMATKLLTSPRTILY